MIDLLFLVAAIPLAAVLVGLGLLAACSRAEVKQ